MTPSITKIVLKLIRLFLSLFSAWAFIKHSLNPLSIFCLQTTYKAIFRGTQPPFPPKYIKNTFKAIQSTFRSLVMHSKGRYKICTCSVILGELESFRDYNGFSIIFPKIVDICNIMYYENENFTYSSLHHIFDPKI